VTLPGIIRAKF